MKEFLNESLSDEEIILCAEAAQIYEEERNQNNGEKADDLQSPLH